MTCLVLLHYYMYIYKKAQKNPGREGETLVKQTSPSWKIPKFVGINFKNAAIVVKAPNEGRVIKVLYKQARNQEFFRVRKVSWNIDS